MWVETQCSSLHRTWNWSMLGKDLYLLNHLSFHKNELHSFHMLPVSLIYLMDFKFSSGKIK